MQRPTRTLLLACAVLLGGWLPAVPAGAADLQIVALGTSFTAGKGVGLGEAFPAKLEKLLREQGEPVRVANQGVNGDTTLDLQRRLERAVPPGTAIVILEFALGNDRRRGLSTEDTVRNTGDLVAALVARKAQVLLVIRAGTPQALARHVAWFSDTVARYGIAHIAIEQPESSLQADHQHPSADAHGQIAASMVAPVKALMALARAGAQGPAALQAPASTTAGTHRGIASVQAHIAWGGGPAVTGRVQGVGAASGLPWGSRRKAEASNPRACARCSSALMRASASTGWRARIQA